MSPAGDGTIELYLLRHAHAGDRDHWRGPDDERPLSGKGRRQSERLADLLATLGFRPDVIVSSPKARADQTAAIVAERLGMEVRRDERLGGALDLRLLGRVLDDLAVRRPMLVGHDPDFSELVAVLCDSTRIPMRKGALARIDLERPPREGGGVLRWLIPPDLLKGSSGDDE